jgi:hypothetical protein
MLLSSRILARDKKSTAAAASKVVCILPGHCRDLYLSEDDARLRNQQVAVAPETNRRAGAPLTPPRR